MSTYSSPRGPCDEYEVLGLHPDLLEPTCILNKSKVGLDIREGEVILTSS
jgi:hypothetical protein